jgi:hypothetical protein
MSKVSSTSSSLAEAITAGVVAVMALGAAVWVGWMLGWPWIIDINDPDFNPMIILEALLIAVAVWHVFKSLRWYSRHRRFGQAVLVLDAPPYLRLGRALSGVVRVERPVLPAGPYRIELTCHDVHDTGRPGNPHRQSFPVWSAERQLPAATDAQKGLRFSFDLPASVGPDPVPSGILPANKYFRFRMTVNIPGFRRVIQKDRPPVDRFWMLVVTAPVRGADFRCALPVPLRDA